MIRYNKKYHDNDNIKEERWTNKEGIVHRDCGPAYIWYSNVYQRFFIKWYVMSNDITEEVNDWIKRNNIPDWNEWTSKEKAMFKMMFVK